MVLEIAGLDSIILVYQVLCVRYFERAVCGFLPVRIAGQAAAERSRGALSVVPVGERDYGLEPLLGRNRLEYVDQLVPLMAHEVEVTEPRRLHQLVLIDGNAPRSGCLDREVVGVLGPPVLAEALPRPAPGPLGLPGSEPQVVRVRKLGVGLAVERELFGTAASVGERRGLQQLALDLLLFLLDHQEQVLLRAQHLQTLGVSHLVQRLHLLHGLEHDGVAVLDALHVDHDEVGRDHQAHVLEAVDVLHVAQLVDEDVDVVVALGVRKREVLRGVERVDDESYLDEQIVGVEVVERREGLIHKLLDVCAQAILLNILVGLEQVCC